MFGSDGNSRCNKVHHIQCGGVYRLAVLEMPITGMSVVLFCHSV